MRRQTMSWWAWILVVPFLAAACSSDNPEAVPTSLPTTVPSAVPTSVPSGIFSSIGAVGEAFCGHVNDVFEILQDAEGSSGQVLQDMVDEMQQLSSDLQEDASNLRDDGQDELAAAAQGGALALAGLALVIQQNPDMEEVIQSAVGTVNDAIGDLPGQACPTATP